MKDEDSNSARDTLCLLEEEREFVSHKLRGVMSNKLRATLTESLHLLPIPPATSSGKAAQSAPLSLASGKSGAEYRFVLNMLLRLGSRGGWRAGGGTLKIIFFLGESRPH